MDHQQNFEYSDPNFGFINSFSGSDNFMIPPDQQQQLNGKTHEDGLQQLTSFGSEHQATLYSSEPAPMFHLPDTMASPPIHYPDNNVNFHHQTTPPEAINVQKDPNFASVEPVLAVPVNIIHDQPEPTTVEPMEVDPEKEIVSSTAIEENPHIEVVQESENEKAQEVLVESQEVLVDSPAIPTSSPKPAVISPEQNNMMKALGVMRKEYFSPSGTSKKRRRILQLNDSDDECDLKKELQISPEKKVEEEVESEESETDADPEAIKARSLLKSAVIIHGPASRKKKRVLESDEEDEMLTSVDDIGLIETNENENDEEMFNSDIIVDIGYDTTEKVVPIENPIIVQDDFVEPKPPGEKEKVDEDGNNLDENKLEESVKDEEKKTVKTEDCEIDPAMSVEAILDNIKPMADDE